MNAMNVDSRWPSGQCTRLQRWRWRVRPPTFGGISEIHISNRYSLQHRGTWNGQSGNTGILWPVMSGVITGKELPCTKMDRYNKYQTKQYTHALTHTHTLHSQQMVASTWLGDHHGRPSVPAIHPSTAIDIWRVTSQVLIILMHNYLILCTLQMATQITNTIFQNYTVFGVKR